MSINHNHQMIPYFNEQDVSHAMIAILEEQSISNEDLQTIDRDDIDHLFKNSSGFTFRDRKQFWNAIQKLRASNTKNDVICLEQEPEILDVPDVTDNQMSNFRLTQHFVPIAPSRTPTSMRIYSPLNMNSDESVLELSSSEEERDRRQVATTSLPAPPRPVKKRRRKESSPVVFIYPVELPTFSPKIMAAFEENCIASQWTALVHELADWIFGKKQAVITMSEYEAIGRTLFINYPSIARDGFRPWSCLCRSVTQRIRKMKKKNAEKINN